MVGGRAPAWLAGGLRINPPSSSLSTQRDWEGCGRKGLSTCSPAWASSSAGGTSGRLCPELLILTPCWLWGVSRVGSGGALGSRCKIWLVSKGPLGLNLPPPFSLSGPFYALPFPWLPFWLGAPPALQPSPLSSPTGHPRTPRPPWLRRCPWTPWHLHDASGEPGARGREGGSLEAGGSNAGVRRKQGGGAPGNGAERRWPNVWGDMEPGRAEGQAGGLRLQGSDEHKVWSKE